MLRKVVSSFEMAFHENHTNLGSDVAQKIMYLGRYSSVLWAHPSAQLTLVLLAVIGSKSGDYSVQSCHVVLLRIPHSFLTCSFTHGS